MQEVVDEGQVNLLQMVQVVQDDEVQDEYDLQMQVQQVQQIHDEEVEVDDDRVLEEMVDHE